MATPTKQILNNICKKLNSMEATTNDNSEIVACLEDIKLLLDKPDSVDYEFKVLNRQCFKCPDESIYTEVLCAKYEDGVFIENIIQYIVGTTVVSAPPCIGVPCVETIECNPAMESFTGDNATLTEFNEFTVFVPKCCELTITTSAGNITLPAQECKWNFSQTFKCFVSNYTLS